MGGHLWQEADIIGGKTSRVCGRRRIWVSPKPVRRVLACFFFRSPVSFAPAAQICHFLFNGVTPPASICLFHQVWSREKKKKRKEKVKVINAHLGFRGGLEVVLTFRSAGAPDPPVFTLLLNSLTLRWRSRPPVLNIDDSSGGGGLLLSCLWCRGSFPPGGVVRPPEQTEVCFVYLLADWFLFSRRWRSCWSPWTWRRAATTWA